MKKHQYSVKDVLQGMSIEIGFILLMMVVYSGVAVLL